MSSTKTTGYALPERYLIRESIQDDLTEEKFRGQLPDPSEILHEKRNMSPGAAANDTPGKLKIRERHQKKEENVAPAQI